MTFFKTSLKLSFEQIDKNEDQFLEEYLNLGKSADFSRLKKLASKIDFSEGEEFLFHMLLGIKEDLSELKLRILKQDELLKLANEENISAFNFEHFKLAKASLIPANKYYARLELSSHLISFFFIAKENDLAEISKIKADDKALWDNFVVQMQRDMIKDLRSKNE